MPRRRRLPPLAAALAPTLPSALCLPQVPLSSFSYLFSELVQYSQARAATVGDLERRLEDAGAGVGERLLEVLATRERAGRREARLLDALKFVHTTLWRYMFGRQARDLEQSNTVRRALLGGPFPAPAPTSQCFLERPPSAPNLTNLTTTTHHHPHPPRPRTSS